MINLQLVAKKDPALKAVCEPVTPGDDVSDIIEGMFKVMRQKLGVGLAAPQVGVTKRIILIEYGATCTAIINPVIIKRPGKLVTSIGEGCLSFPGKKINIKRNKRVVVEGFNQDWEPIKIDARNLLAFIVQHEVDHLNGVTIV
tara:strand:+ start:2715 stop:3143 length:429 start_codon:yes stop_codon:yes gene_type:complete